MTDRYVRKPNTSCAVCKKRIYRRPSEIYKSKGVYCGQACYGLACRRENPCIVCGVAILARYHKKTCSRSCANINRSGIKYHQGRPRDKVVSQQALKARLVKGRGSVCERCSFDEVAILQVHHISRDRTDNRLENLELICPNCHAKEHHLSK